MAEGASASKKDFDKLRYLESVIENITDIVTILEADGTIRYESPSITPILGYTPEELIGKNGFNFVHPDDYKRVFGTFMAGVLANKAMDKVEVRSKHKDGSWRYLECSAKNLLLDPQVYGVVVSSRDITERRDAELQRRLQSHALEAASNGVVITDTEGKIVWVNAAFSRMTGYSSEEVIGKNPRILKSGEQSRKVYEELWSTILTGKTWSGELINRRKDGSLYFEKQTITPVMDDPQTITHFIAIKEDISSDKKLEAQFRQAQKMEAVGRLAGGVAHDFNNLLTVIIGQSDIALNDMAPGNPMHGRIQEVRNCGARAANLTRQLLAFSRKQIFQIKSCDLNEIVLGSDKMLRRLLGEDVELVTMLGQNLKPIKVDAAQIEQVLMNLAVNARDAMPKGGKLVIETSEVTVDSKRAANFPGFVPGNYLQLKIQDTGTGINPEVKAHLFEPFFTTKEKGKGTGLGLATVYGIIKQSKGFIYVETEENKGTAFLIFIPPSDESLAAKDGDPNLQKLPSGSETILIVEDEELLRAFVINVFSRQGFHVLEARNGLEALRTAESHQGPPIQMVITDMVMPYMGGGELAEKFLTQRPNTPIIFTSGYLDQSMVQKWIDQGYRFLQKPYTHAELLLTVREVFDKEKS